MIKKLSVFILFVIFATFGFAQNKGASLNVFSDQEPFLLYINDILYNEKPHTKVRVESLPNRLYDLRVEFKSTSSGIASMSHLKVYNELRQALEITMLAGKSKSGDNSLILFSLFPIDDSTPSIQEFTTYSFGRPQVPLFGQQEFFAVHQMSIADFNDFLKALKTESFDKEKMNIAILATKDYFFSVEQISQAMKIFSWDDGKMEFVKLMFNNCLDKTNYLNLTNQFTFSTSKDKFISCLNSQPLDNGYLIQMTAKEFEDFLSLLKQENFDNEKVKLINTLSVSVSFSVAEIRAIMKTLSFDEGKLNTSKMLFATCSDKNKYYTLATEFSFSSTRKELQDFLKR